MKVCVRMITYNHAKYIAQAVESVLMQETNFPYELIIGEDCSTDGTRDIVVDYQRRYPDKIRLLLAEQNLGALENARRTRAASRGQYIALLEGDDYWTSPFKLQKQVDFLDTHSECALCFHATEVVYEDGSKQPHLFLPPGRKPTYQLEDLLQGNFMVTCSVMFRNGLVSEIPEWCYHLPIGDWPLNLLHAQHGEIGYLDEALAVYRKHGGGVYTSRSYDRRFDDVVRMYDAFSRHFEHRYDRIITGAKRRHMAELVVEKVKAADSFEEGIAVAHSTLEQWQKAYAFPDAWRNKALGHVYAHFLFSRSDGHSDRRIARRCFARIIRYDPSWLRNPGVWSVAVESYLGPRVGHWLRSLWAGHIQSKGDLPVDPRISGEST